ncbi:MAG TPA: alanine racemase [Candidatus Krumholzibacteria bacterium]|nr:alanine racemase [Candidatus Krumholzibacteria bacterium]
MTTTLPAWVEVDLDALAHNVGAVRRLIRPQTRILFIVKADAYGHGAVEVAREAVRAGVHMLGVATVDEGRELRAAGTDAAILVLSPCLPEEIPALLEAQLRTTVPDLEFAARLAEAARRRHQLAPVHVEVDTGMGRSGIHASLAAPCIEQLSRLPGLLLEGVFTHFPVSDTDPEFTRAQCTAFTALVARLRAAGIQVPLVHASNSAGILDLREADLDMVRPGGMLYGCLPYPNLATPVALRPVMSFHARLVQVRHLPARSPISYGGDVHTWRAADIGVVPVGYGHGLSRAFSGRGCMLFRGRRVPILGRVTMDMTMVDLTGSEAPQVGEEVVLFGAQGEERISVDEIAAHTGVIGYEVLCGISKRVVRVFRRHGGVESMRGLTGVRQLQA